MDIDLVITYVDGNDEEWQRCHFEMLKATGRDKIVKAARFRDWGTLQFVLRGAAAYMPWLRNVYLVVERESQVPAWINRKEVIVVYHEEIIPSRFLPTYNSTAIEMYLWRIPGISEYWLYANDDMIPMGEMTAADWYDTNGHPRIAKIVKPYNDAKSMYAHHLHNGERLVRKLLALPENDLTHIRTGHNIAPMVNSTWEGLWTMAGEEIECSISTFRNYRNINQELCAYWHILAEKYCESERRTDYMELADIRDVCNRIAITNAQLICLNDNKTCDYTSGHKKIYNALLKRLPLKSKYEL